MLGHLRCDSRRIGHTLVTGRVSPVVAPAWVPTLFAATAAFSTYFCMYAFRKPFAAGHYAGLTFLGTDVELKTVFVISQLVGYALSKFIGIKVCSEATRRWRALLLASLIIVSEAALFLFATLPGNGKVLAIFLSGLPLGMVWGLVVAYLEGRRTSELLLAILSCSFIVSSGAVKDVGRALMADFGVSEWWMPAATGAIFLPPFLIFVWLLNQIPDPSPADVLARVKREPMDDVHRAAFFRRFLPGMTLLLIVYFFITAYRDFRDNYGVEIFAELGYGGEPAIFTRTELPVAFGVIAMLAALNLIRNNRRGVVGAFAIMVFGIALLGIGTVALDVGLISGALWMILTGLGTFLVFVPYGSVLFDRIIASTGVVGTAVFTIMVADAVGYTGSIGLQLARDLIYGDTTRLDFFRSMSYLLAVVGTALLAIAGFYFCRQGLVRDR